MKKAQVIALEDLVEIDTESVIIEDVEILELFGSGWVHDRIASTTIGFHKDVTKRGKK